MKMDVAREVLDRHYLTPLFEPGPVAIVGASGKSGKVGAVLLSNMFAATLKNVLNSPIRRHHWVRKGLQGMRQAIENGLETVVADGLKAGQYIAEIGRILGM